MGTVWLSSWLDWLKPRPPVPTPIPAPVNGSRDPKGYFVILEGKGKITYPDDAWKNPAVTGFCYRTKWKDVQSGPGKFDWGRLDDFLAKIRGTGKLWKLEINAGAASPDWVYAKGVRKMNFKRTNPNNQSGNPEYMPTPWDAFYLELYNDLLKAAAMRYDAHPTLTLVQVGGPTRDSNEMMLPDEVEKQSGFSKQAISGAWRTCILSFKNNFKTANGCINVGNPVNERDGIAKDVADYWYSQLGDRAWVKHCSLSAKSSLTYNIHELVNTYGKAGKHVGFEQLDASVDKNGNPDSRFGGSWQDALKKVGAANANFYDIYRNDLRFVKAPLPK